MIGAMAGGQALSGNPSLPGGQILSGGQALSGDQTLSGGQALSGVQTLSGGQALSGSVAHAAVHMAGAVTSLEGLLDQRRLWKGRAAPRPSGLQPTGHGALDAVLPSGGWPESALSEILLPAHGCGELHLLWPSLARLTASGERVVLVAPPYVPYAPAWQAAGIDLRHLAVIAAEGKDALWAAEQCLRSGSCGAVLCWPNNADDKSLRRLQVAAQSGQTLAFACRPQSAALNASPAALRMVIELDPPQWRVLKCRGGVAPAGAIAAASATGPR